LPKKGFERGNFLGPTPLRLGKASDPAVACNPAYAEEIFGPVLGLVEADTLEEAIAFINRR